MRLAGGGLPVLLILDSTTNQKLERDALQAGASVPQMGRLLNKDAKKPLVLAHSHVPLTRPP